MFRYTPTSFKMPSEAQPVRNAYKRLKYSAKVAVLGTALLASAYLGDRNNVIDNYIHSALYKDVPVAAQMYQKPENLELEKIINKEGMREVYIKDRETGDRVAVNRDMEATRSPSESILKKAKDLYDQGVDYAKKGAKKVKDVVDDNRDVIEQAKDMYEDARKTLGLWFYNAYKAVSDWCSK